MASTMKALSASNDNLTVKSSKSFFKKLDRWIKVGGIARSLHQLDDRTLDDIGVTRDDIRTFAEKIVDNDNQNAA